MPSAAARPSHPSPSPATSPTSGAFYGCASLTAINVSANNAHYASINGVLFDKARSTLIACPGGFSGPYAIPNSVTVIGEGAFGGCASLTSVTIPGNVTDIGDYAFDGCTALTSVSILGSVTTIGEGAFYECSSLTSVSILR
jgi:hypothetical protein